MFRRIGGILIVGLVGMGIAYANGQRESAAAPTVGQCAKVVGKDSVERVACTDPAATLRVTTRHEDTADGEAACANDSEATSYYTFEEKSRGSTLVSFVVCFADI